MRRPTLFLAFWLLGSLVLAFIVVPLLSLAAAPGLAGLLRAAAMPDVRAAIALSLGAAFVAALIAAAFGVPLAYVLARSAFPGKGVVEAVVDLPLTVPHTVAGIVVAMLFVSLPYAVNAARIGFEEAIDPHLEKVARTLGAGPWRVFTRIALPLAWRGVMAGVTLTFARAISEFATVALLAYYPMTAPIKVYELFLRFGLDDATGAAVLFLGIVLLLFVALRQFAYGRGGSRGFGR